MNEGKPDFIEVRCPNCDKRLLDVSGPCCIIITICPRCKVKIRWPVMVGEIVEESPADRQKPKD